VLDDISECGKADFGVVDKIGDDFFAPPSSVPVLKLLWRVPVEQCLYGTTLQTVNSYSFPRSQLETLTIAGVIPSFTNSSKIRR